MQVYGKDGARIEVDYQSDGVTMQRARLYRDGDLVGETSEMGVLKVWFEMGADRVC